MKKILFILCLATFSLLIISCSVQNQDNAGKPNGKLYIIGGGDRPTEMVQQLIDLSEVEFGRYIIVLPMSSEDVDTAAYYSMKQFKDLGVSNITWFNFKKDELMEQTKLDSLINAGMIYISGGDQNRFMEIANGTPLVDAIHQAYHKGAIIAGTSAGAAVQSKKMITGNQHLHPDMKGYKTIQPKNIEIAEGLGLIESAIIDQHFIWRERMNRLISVCIENPNELAIGIDESTAILVDNNVATVYGKGQVLVLNATQANIFSSDSLLGAENIRINLYLPGQSFNLKP